MNIKIKTALISVYHKEGLENIIKCLSKNNVKIYSTGGSYEYIKEIGVESIKIEEITDYPSIFDGRVKTLHPKIFGGILAMRNNTSHEEEAQKYAIPLIDLVIVDLYPFEETVQKGYNDAMIIEKIDIGGISLIRAAAKNFNDVLVVSSSDQYEDIFSLLEDNKCTTNKETRRQYAQKAFAVSSHYDTSIFNWFDNNENTELKISHKNSISLRYGENPHQEAKFYGNFDEIFTQLHGKEISYNNLLDCESALNLINDFSEPTIAVLKHNNPCGIASRENLTEAWKYALEGDPVSAFGGIIISNSIIDNKTANEINKIFFEIIIAPNYAKEALELLSKKQNRIVLSLKNNILPKNTFRSVLNGILVQNRDISVDKVENFNYVTKLKPNEKQIDDLIFASKVVKHTKSNGIVLVKNKQLIGSGMGQTSRVDALKQAIDKAKQFKFKLEGAVMSSDAFFPFSDCVEIALKEGLTTIIQPGGSIRDNDSITFCNEHNMIMVFSGVRHFKH